MKVKHKQFSPTEISQYENVKNTIWEKFKLNTVNNVYLILNKINKHKNSLGDFVECGTFKGSTLLTAAQFCKENNIDKKLVGIDTFGGFPYKGSNNPFDLPEFFEVLFKNQKISQTHFNQAKLRTDNFTNLSHLNSEYFLDTEEVFANCKSYKNIELIVGTFKSITPTYDKPISILHLDGDLYGSYTTCLNNLYNNITPGGCIIFDEYYSHKYPGARVAVDEFFADKENEGYFEKYITSEGHERWCFEKNVN